MMQQRGSRQSFLRWSSLRHLKHLPLKRLKKAVRPGFALKPEHRSGWGACRYLPLSSGSPRGRRFPRDETSIQPPTTSAGEALRLWSGTTMMDLSRRRSVGGTASKPARTGDVTRPDPPPRGDARGGEAGAIRDGARPEHSPWSSRRGGETRSEGYRDRGGSGATNEPRGAGGEHGHYRCSWNGRSAVGPYRRKSHCPEWTGARAGGRRGRSGQGRRRSEG